MDIEERIPIGWRPLYEPIKKYIKKHNILQPFSKIKINGVNTSNNSLDFSVENSNTKLEKLMSEIRDESSNTCMLCGSKKTVGVLQDGSNTVICYECALKKVEEEKSNLSWYSNDESEELIIPYIFDDKENLTT
jgi:hypothetical protein